MNIAIWIIAIVEVIRMIQNFVQIRQIKKANDNSHVKRATDEFIKSLKRTDKEFVEEMLAKIAREMEQGNDNRD